MVALTVDPPLLYNAGVVKLFKSSLPVSEVDLLNGSRVNVLLFMTL